MTEQTTLIFRFIYFEFEKQGQMVTVPSMITHPLIRPKRYVATVTSVPLQKERERKDARLAVVRPYGGIFLQQTASSWSSVFHSPLYRYVPPGLPSVRLYSRLGSAFPPEGRNAPNTSRSGRPEGESLKSPVMMTCGAMRMEHTESTAAFRQEAAAIRPGSEATFPPEREGKWQTNTSSVSPETTRPAT